MSARITTDEIRTFAEANKFPCELTNHGSVLRVNYTDTHFLEYATAETYDAAEIAAVMTKYNPPKRISEYTDAELQAVFTSASKAGDGDLCAAIDREQRRRANPAQQYGRGVRRQVGTIDLTPTWVSLLPALLIAYMEGSDKGRAIALEELKRMAQAADAYNKETRS